MIRQRLPQQLCGAALEVNSISINEATYYSSNNLDLIVITDLLRTLYGQQDSSLLYVKTTSSADSAEFVLVSKTDVAVDRDMLANQDSLGLTNEDVDNSEPAYDSDTFYGDIPLEGMTYSCTSTVDGSEAWINIVEVNGPAANAGYDHYLTGAIRNGSETVSIDGYLETIQSNRYVISGTNGVGYIEIIINQMDVTVNDGGYTTLNFEGTYFLS